MTPSRSLLAALLATFALQGVAFYLIVARPYLGEWRRHRVAVFQALEEVPLEAAAMPKGLLAQLIAEEEGVHTPAEWERALARCGCFSSLSVAQQPEDTLLVSYVMREPIYLLGDRSNSCLATDGTIMAYHPFFTPKQLPTVYVGVRGAGAPCLWNKGLSPALWDSIRLTASALQRLAVRWHMHLETLDLTRCRPGPMTTGEVLATLASTVGPKERHKRVILRLGLYDEALLNKVEQLAKLDVHIGSWLQEGGGAPLVVDYRCADFALVGH